MVPSAQAPPGPSITGAGAQGASLISHGWSEGRSQGGRSLCPLTSLPEGGLPPRPWLPWGQADPGCPLPHPQA